MDFNYLVGHQIAHKKWKKGIITNVDNDKLEVDFNGEKKSFTIKTMDQYFSFDNEETEKLVLKAIKEIVDAENAAKEAERIACEKAEQIAKEKAIKKEKEQAHPYVAEKRSKNRPAIFLVCQNSNYEIESTNGFIWAPTHNGKSDSEVASHEELDLVEKGDIIFHHFSNKIYAISIAESDRELKAPPIGHPNAGTVGRYVELRYYILENAADTKCLKNEKATYGSKKYGPFDKNGDNKQGFYLSELHDNIAKLFIEAAIQANPSNEFLLEIKNRI